MTKYSVILAAVMLAIAAPSNSKAQDSQSTLSQIARPEVVPFQCKDIGSGVQECWSYECFENESTQTSGCFYSEFITSYVPKSTAP